MGALHQWESGERLIDKRRKQSEEIIVGFSLKPAWLFVKHWLPLAFWFHNLEALTGLGFGLLTWAATALAPPQSNGLHV